MEALFEAHVGSNNDSMVACFCCSVRDGLDGMSSSSLSSARWRTREGGRCSAKALGWVDGWVRMGCTAGQRKRRRPSSLFGYISFLQDDLSLPGGQLGLVIAQGP